MTIHRLHLLALLGVATAALAVVPGSAQEFLPPEQPNRRGGFFVGLEGFSARLGLDVTDDDEAVVGVGLDLGNLGSSRFRLRSVGEFGLGSGPGTYVVGADIVYRFTDDAERAIPYVGLGPGVFTADDCTVLTDCPKVWLQFSLGFELRLRRGMNWLVEYRAQDGFGRHRVFVGLTTKRGGG